jgi:phage shock protein C
MFENIKYGIEKQAFGVCSYLGEKLGVPGQTVRLYFIYTSCLTLGSPLIIYLVLAFWLNFKDYTQSSRHSIWDL